MEESKKLRKKYLDSFDKRLSRIERKLNLTAGECICTHRMLPEPDCPLHGTATKCTCNIKSKEVAGICNYCYPRSNWTAGEKSIWEDPVRCVCNHHDHFYWPSGHRPQCPKNPNWKEFSLPPFNPKPTPDLPLHARVAKANGKDVKYLEGVELGKDGWYYWNPHAHGGARWVLIPRCDKIVDEAMGALEEYCREHDCFLNIYGGSDRKWEIQIFDKGTHIARVSKSSTSFSDAICLAIVAHAEQQ